MTLELTRFQRILLGTDGTVTALLEAFAGEPMQLMKLHQAFDTSKEGDPGTIEPGVKVLRRRVLLSGRHTRRSLVYAEAVVVIERVDSDVLDGLVGTDKAIGVLLAESRTETFREILGVDREPAGDLSARFGIEPTDDVLWRTYRILSGGQTAIVITEKFPADVFRNLPT